MSICNCSLHFHHSHIMFLYGGGRLLLIKVNLICHGQLQIHVHAPRLSLRNNNIKSSAKTTCSKELFRVEQQERARWRWSCPDSLRDRRRDRNNHDHHYIYHHHHLFTCFSFYFLPVCFILNSVDTKFTLTFPRRLPRSLVILIYHNLMDPTVCMWGTTRSIIDLDDSPRPHLPHP